MKVRCDRVTLVDSLNSILGIVPSTTSKPVLKDFFLTTESGSLVAEATDLEIAGRVAIHKVEVLEEGSIALPSTRLTAILKEIDEELVDLSSIPDGQGAVIEGPGFEFRVLGHDPAEFPKLHDPDTPMRFTISREKLHDSLKRVCGAASHDPTRYQLDGVFLEFTGGKLLLTATDGKRLAHDSFRVDSEGDQQVSAILPNQAVDVILKMLAAHGLAEDTVILALSETHAMLKTNDNVISSTLVEGSFPNYRAVFPPEPKVRVKGVRTALLGAARSAALTTDKDTLSVVFRVGAESVTFESASQDVGQARIEIPAEVSGGEMEISFNPVFFIDALRAFDEEVVTIEILDTGHPAVLRGAHEYRHLIMPLAGKGQAG